MGGGEVKIGPAVDGAATNYASKCDYELYSNSDFGSLRIAENMAAEGICSAK